MSRDNQNYFLSDANIRMLWEIILDDDVVVNKNREEVTTINTIFLKVAQQFYDKEKGTFKDLIQMNKKFISIIVHILNQNFPKPKPLVIHEKETTPITAEEIQKTRANEFDQEFNKKQEEFTRAMALPVPDVPIFSDNSKDEPISELDAVVKRAIAERNLEIQQITKSFNNEGAENWIKSSETSLRTEKQKEQEAAEKNFKIEKLTSAYDVPLQKTKHISWAENLIENNEPQEISLSIYELEANKNNSYNSSESLESKFDALNKKFDLLFSMVEKLVEDKKNN
jgi:hypothetical protein